MTGRTISTRSRHAVIMVHLTLVTIPARLTVTDIATKLVLYT